MATYIGYIYSVTNLINGKIYIGKTNNLRRRWNEHKYGYTKTSILKRAIKKYGVENFLFDVVAEIPFDTTEELNSVLDQLEIYYIELYDTYKNGYNATIGGEGISFYHHSEETKKKISRSNKGRVLSEETKRKCRIANLGHHHTEDAKRRIREALLARDHEIYERAAAKRRGVKRDYDMIMQGANKRRKPILQYDLDGNFIREYPGAIAANRAWKSGICSCCKGKLKEAYGYIWRYKTKEDYALKIDAPKNIHIENKVVYQYNTNGDYITSYENMSVAAKQTNINRSAISNCLCGLSNSSGGYVWKYERKEEVA